MGFLHQGHQTLIRTAKKENDVVVVTMFVNPTQFAPDEDFTRYPRDRQRDIERAEESGADIFFSPTVQEMYPDGFSSYVVVEELSSVLEGKFRPTHFKGVTTIVAKLFNIAQPDTAYFGQKDAQQAAVIKKMAGDLNFSCRIIVVPTVRESDGLAMSSRNVYLTADERKNAPVIFAALKNAEQQIAKGERNSASIISAIAEMIQAKNPSAIDYIEIVDAVTLRPKPALTVGDEVLIPVAVRFGATRLIDNITIRVQ